MKSTITSPRFHALMAMAILQAAGCGIPLVEFGVDGEPTPPTVVSTVPVDDDVDVSTAITLSAVFSEAMDPNTINGEAFTLHDGAVAIAGVVSWNAASNTAFFDPDGALDVGVVYTATITTDARDRSGTPMAADVVWTFTSANSGGPPVVITTDPLDGDVEVSIGTEVSASFSRAVAPGSVNTDSFTLSQGATPVGGVVSLNEATNTATFAPDAPLELNRQYTATLTTTVTDTDGNPLAANVVWQFTTESDALPPTVVDVFPDNASVNVAIGTSLTATFSKPMDPLTINDLTFTVFDGATQVPGTVSLSLPQNTATFAPTANLDDDTLYTATITTDATDTAGRPLAANFVWTFRTTLLGVPPTVVDEFPNNNAINVNVGTAPTARFSTAMDPLSLNALTFTVSDAGATVAGVVSFAVTENTATFTPTVDLDQDTLYTATITTGAEDQNGQGLATAFVWTFRTEVAGLPPVVIQEAPVNGSTSASINASMTVEFNTAMDPTTIDELSFTVRQGQTDIAGTVSYDAATNTATFKPDTILGVDLLYTATVTTDVTDIDGVPLAADFVWTFTTDDCGLERINLRTAANFVVLGGSAITNVGPSSITGDIGVSPGTAVNNFGVATQVGSIHIATPIAAQAQADLTRAFDDAAVQSLCRFTITELTSLVPRPPGVYTSGTTLNLASDAVILDAEGNPDAVWIFQAGSGLNFANGTQVQLINGAKASNVFWLVGSSATIGTTAQIHGTILALESITINSGASLVGRALARNGAVTVDDNAITRPAP